MNAKVSICIATCRRPAGLRRLLDGLNQLHFPSPTPPEVELVVVDNDPEGSARELCESLGRTSRWPLRYRWEQRPGISFARNHAVHAASPDADFIAFLDDDEVPDPHWLGELLRVQREHDADLVAGPVVPHFEGDVPEWVLRGRFFDLRRYRTGEQIEHAGTGNVLIRAALLRQREEPFDPRMALSGGEDTLFFLRFAAEGRRMVWADEALVREWVPPERASAGWILRRAYRVGNTWSLCEREMQPSLRVTVLRIVKGVGRVVQGLLLLPGGVRGRHALVRSARYVSLGLGNLTGVVGMQFQEYRTRASR